MNFCKENRAELMNRLRQLWTQHVYWTRLAIISAVYGSDDADFAAKRLLRNPKDFAALLAPFYGREKAENFDVLLTEHLTVASELVGAAKEGNTQKVDSARRRWYNNADEIAWFLSGINPRWNREKWRKMLYSHLEMTEKEALLRIGKNYAEDIANFEVIEKEALEMADYMFRGMVPCLQG